MSSASTSTSTSTSDLTPIGSAPPPGSSRRPAGRRALDPRWVRAWLLARVVAGPLAAIVVIVMMQSGAIPLYYTFTVALAAVYGILVLSLSLLAHWGGVWSIGHPALLAVGAYSAAWGSGHGWSLEVTALFAMVVCAAFGAFLGFAGSRFSVLYIALLTLAFALVALEVINVWKEVTNGDQGVPIFQFSSTFGEVFAADETALSIVVAVFGVTLAVAELVRRTAVRMRFVASKTHPLAARTVGIAPEMQSALVFAGSAAAAGLGGVMLGLVSGFASPESFSLVLAVNLIAATVLGGTGSLIGAVVGGAFLAWAPSIADGVGVDQPYLVGALLILVLIFLPEGVVPTIASRLDRLTGWTERLRQAALAGQDLSAELVETEVAARDDRVGATEAGERARLLEVRGLGVRYGGLQAVEDVDLELHPGEVLAIIGPNGAGKTTFVNALSGLTGGGKIVGSMTYDGSLELRGRRATRRRRMGLARTFQHAELFDELTVIENVLVVNRRIGRSDRAHAYRLLSSVGLAEVAHRLPSELPFGLQKRVDLARAIAESPRMIVLDEPFGGLDADEREVLAGHIRRLRARGTSVIIIDHVLEDLFAVADRVVAFDFGRLVAEGTPETVLQDPVVRKSYLGEIDGRSTAPAPGSSGELVVRLAGVAHHYGGVRALEGVDVDLHAGAVLGIVGANGAGKSTLGRILHGSLRPSDGTRTEPGKPSISLVPEGRALFKTLSVRENLEVAAYAAGVRGSELRRRLTETTALLPERVRTRMEISAGSLSGGEQQLVAIARALIAEPEVLILDEPALGLSPVMVQEVYGQIEALAARGITTVLLDQSLNRALQSCSEVLVLRQGAVVARGSAAEPGFEARAEEAYFGDETPVETTHEESP
ncbi:ATP-binding cassette domain-containing protein [Nocardioides plantarum]|uniref:ATP-binding cassette domain-containing protein n=1 Tax=Nocardioides plantarum TaxID=29299 RepID=A0ABV5KHD1_9ACTN|nr:ATP-binding cassette domain-containing protein [Nocardioides plantarum]